MAKNNKATRAAKAKRLQALLVRVNRLRAELAALEDDPLIEEAADRSPFDHDRTLSDCFTAVECALHRISDGAALSVADLAAQ